MLGGRCSAILSTFTGTCRRSTRAVLRTGQSRARARTVHVRPDERYTHDVDAHIDLVGVVCPVERKLVFQAKWTGGKRHGGYGSCTAGCGVPTRCWVPCARPPLIMSSLQIRSPIACGAPLRLTGGGSRRYELALAFLLLASAASRLCSTMSVISQGKSIQTGGVVSAA